MKRNSFMKFLLCVFLVTLTNSLTASSWTAWNEHPTNPIYNPYPTSSLPEDFFPYVVFDKHRFYHDDGCSTAAYYKMWHQGTNSSGSIALSYSDDGVNWTLKGETNLSSAYHPVVLYDKHGFNEEGKPYRMWFWTGTASISDVGVIQFTQSDDGITWDAPQAITQDSESPLLMGSGLFYELYGPGFVIYNSSATSVPGHPYSYPYVMFYDIANVDPTDQAESIALAYSDDGMHWTRFGCAPVLIPSGLSTDWDATHIYRPSVIKSQGVYHMFYSGSNQYVDETSTVVYAHGIGHASSTNGIDWTRDSDPIFINSDGMEWRDTRTYTPFVLFGKFCDANKCVKCIGKMWFVGGIGTVPGTNQSIGYATLPCPK